MLLWPAVWNGYPIVFADTGTYLAQAIHRFAGWDRPVFYSMFMLPLHATSDALAGYRRSGGARGMDPLAGLPGAASQHFTGRFRRWNGDVGGGDMAAVDGERIDAGCVHPTAGPCGLPSDLDTRVSVATRACGIDRIGGVHDRQPAVKFAISMCAAGGPRASPPPAWSMVFCRPSRRAGPLQHLGEVPIVGHHDNGRR